RRRLSARGGASRLKSNYALGSHCYPACRGWFSHVRRADRRPNCADGLALGSCVLRCPVRQPPCSPHHCLCLAGSSPSPHQEHLLPLAYSFVSIPAVADLGGEGTSAPARDRDREARA